MKQLRHFLSALLVFVALGATACTTPTAPSSGTHGPNNMGTHGPNN